MLTDFTLVISSAPGRGLHRAAELARTHGGKIGIAVQTLARAMKLRRRYRDLEILPLWQLPGRIYWDIAILEDGHKMSGWASRPFFRRLKDTTAQVIITADLGKAGSRSWVRRLMREDVSLVRLDGKPGIREAQAHKARQIRLQSSQSLAPAAPSPR